MSRLLFIHIHWPSLVVRRIMRISIRPRSSCTWDSDAGSCPGYSPVSWLPWQWYTQQHALFWDTRHKGSFPPCPTPSFSLSPPSYLHCIWTYRWEGIREELKENGGETLKHVTVILLSSICVPILILPYFQIQQRKGKKKSDGGGGRQWETVLLFILKCSYPTHERGQGLHNSLKEY